MSDLGTLVDKQTQIPTTWLQDANDLLYKEKDISLRRGIVNVMASPYNAVADGTNQKTAIDAAEAAAFAAGATLFFPPGKTFGYAGGFLPRVSIIGWGSTLKQTNSAMSTTDTPGTLHLATLTDVFILGLTVDGNNKWPGITGDGCTRVWCYGTTSKNCVTFGHAFLNSTEIDLLMAKSRTIAYRQTGVAGLSADGFYNYACTGIRYLNCNAADFRRIGFVSEGNNAGTRTSRLKWANCAADNAHDSDDSTTEYNAAFWAENTDDLEISNITGTNLAGNAGQTAGRVRGLVLEGGESRVCNQGGINIHMDGGSGLLPIACQLNGTSQRPTISLENLFLRNCQEGVGSVGGIDVLRLKNVQIDVITSGAANGGILFDISGSAINVIDIDGVKETNATHNADAGTIVFYSGNASTVYALRNLHGGTHVMHSKVGRIEVDASTINYGSATYGSFLADEVRFKGGFRGVLRVGAVKNVLVDTASMAANSLIVFEPGSQIVESSYNQQALGGASVNIRATGAYFDKVGFSCQESGTFTWKFVGCDFLNADATKGVIESSATAFTRWELIIALCRFTATNVANTPLKKSTGNPTFGTFDANTYNTTNLHDFTAGITNTNPHATP